MLTRTQGIVFHTIPYSDNRVIAKIFTRDFGLKSYIVTVSRSKSGKVKAPLLQPLTQLELSVEHKEKNALQSIREISLGVPYATISGDIVKTTVALFVAEVLYKTVREEEQNEALYDFISRSLQVLDLSHEGTSNFHVLFLMKLTKHLGFYPQDNNAGQGSVFDLLEGVFLDQFPNHVNVLDVVESRLFESALYMDFENMHQVLWNGEKRRIALGALLKYYEVHLPSMQKIQSHLVLEQVL